MKERNDVEKQVYAVLNLGRGMIEDKFFDEEKEKEYQHRIDNLERATKLLVLRPVKQLELGRSVETLLVISTVFVLVIIINFV